METIRLFTALPIPSSASRGLQDLPRRGIDARWSHPDDYHITIRFLGEVESGLVPAIESALARVRRPPFGVEVRGTGLFENKQQAVLYAMIESTRKLTALCADITAALTPLGFDFGTRPFVPHITLARLNRRHGIEDYMRRNRNEPRASWRADDFRLMQSGNADTQGRHYTTLSSWPLMA